MPAYRVVWVIDADEDSPREAAEYALMVQRNPASIATEFQVYEQLPDGSLGDPVTVDFYEDEDGEGPR